MSVYAPPAPAKFVSDNDYVLDGATLTVLWSMSEKLCDGSRMDDHQRRNLGQLIQTMLDKVVRFDP